MSLIVLIITILYLIISIIYSKNIPQSLSETSYYWNYKVNPFTIFCVATGLLLVYPWMCVESNEYLCFISIVGMILAGMTPFFKESYQSTLHYSGGIISTICALIWMILNHHIDVVLWDIFFILSLCCFYPKSYVLWIELIVIISICLILL